MKVCLQGLLYLFLAAQPIACVSDGRSNLVGFGFDGFDPGINRSISARDTKEKLVQRFGEPRTLEMREEPDKRDPTVLHIEVYTWQWEGLEIITARPILYKGYDKPYQWITKITLNSPNYRLKFRLSIGTHRKEFIEKLGEPSNQGPKAIAYSMDYYKQERGVTVASHPVVNIWFDGNDRAEKIVWTYHAD